MALKAPTAVTLAVVIGACSGPGPGDAEPVTASSAAVASPEAPRPTPRPSLGEAAVVMPSCSVDGTVHDLATDGSTVFFVGEFSTVTDASGRTTPRDGAAACSIDGAFTRYGWPPIDGTVRTVELVDGRVVLGGGFTVDTGDGRWTNVIALDGSGRPDTEWGPRTVTGGEVQEIYQSEDGPVYLAGGFRGVDGMPQRGIVRLARDGTIDAGFAPELEPAAGTDLVRVYAVAQAGGNVFLGGDFGRVNAVSVPSVAVVDRRSGERTGMFVPALTDENPKDGRVQVREILPHDDGVFLCGDWWSTEGEGSQEQQRNVGFFSLDGTAQPDFSPWTDGGIRDCAIAGESLIIAGHFDAASGERRRKLAQVPLGGSAANGLVDVDTAMGVLAIAVSDDILLVGGAFTTLDGQDQPGLGAVRLAAVGPG